MTTLLVDGNYQLHRVMHVPTLSVLSSTNEGFTGGVYGCLRILKKSIDQFSPNKVIWVWDGGRSPRRLEALPEYKANRAPKTPEEVEERRIYREKFYRQQQILNEMFSYMSVHAIKWPEKEADDVLYALSNSVPGHKVLVSDDWDFAQMVRPDVELFRPLQEQYIQYDTFEEQVGCPQEWYFIQHAILGDKSDNVPGVSGVGKKTVQTAFQEYRRHVNHDLVSEHDHNFFEFCAGSSSKRIAKIAECEEQIMRNIEVVDVRLEEFSTLDVDAMVAKVHIDKYFNEIDFGRQLKKYQMNSIVEEFAFWVQAFRVLR